MDRIRAVAVVALVAASTVSSGGGGADAAVQEAAALGKIAYASNVDGDYEIFVMRADGSNVRQLTDNNVDDVEPAWSPNGRRLVFEQERLDDGYDDLYIVDVRSGVVRPWIVVRELDEGDAAWSPDGRWIAFRGNDWGDGADVVAVTLDRERGRIVSAQSENSTNSDPAWSPDGKHLALVESYDGSVLYVASFCCSHGYKKRALAESGYGIHDVDWSPDGTCIAYTQNAAGASDIYTIRPEGGAPRLVHKAPLGGEVGSWSPDGSRILFHADSAGSYDLYTMRSDGTDVRRLTTTTGVDEITPAWWPPPVAEPHTPECGDTAPPAGLPPKS